MKKVILAGLALAPGLALAQTLSNLQQLLRSIGDLINIATPIVLGIALLVFFWGVVKFIFSSSQEGKSEGKNFMIWGIVGLFVMVSVWGLVRFINTALSINQEASPQVVPFVPGR